GRRALRDMARVLALRDIVRLLASERTLTTLGDRVEASFTPLRPSPEPATQIPVSAAEHLADGPLDNRSEHSESWFDLHVVPDDAAATGVVQQGAFVPPDTVPPTGRGLTKATRVRQGDQLDAMAVDRDEAEQQLPKHRGTYPPR